MLSFAFANAYSVVFDYCFQLLPYVALALRSASLRLLFVVKDYPKGTYPRENHRKAHMCASTNWNALLCLDGFDLPTHTSGREWESEIFHVQKDGIQLSAGFEGIPSG